MNTISKILSRKTLYWIQDSPDLDAILMVYASRGAAVLDERDRVINTLITLYAETSDGTGGRVKNGRKTFVPVAFRSLALAEHAKAAIESKWQVKIRLCVPAGHPEKLTAINIPAPARPCGQADGYTFGA